MRKVLFLTVSFIFLFSFVCFGADVNLAWDQNTEPDIGGYKAYFGIVESGPYPTVEDVGNPTPIDDNGQLTITYKVSNLT